MFTLKFIKTIDGECKSEGELVHAVCCSAYEVYTRITGVVTITVIGQDDKGVEFHLSPSSRDFEFCFVENENGKTVAKYHSQISKEEYDKLSDRRECELIGANGSAR